MFFEKRFISIVFTVKIRRVSRLFIVHVAQIATRNDSVFGSNIWRKAFSVYGFGNLLLTSSRDLIRQRLVLTFMGRLSFRNYATSSDMKRFDRHPVSRVRTFPSKRRI